MNRSRFDIHIYLFWVAIVSCRPIFAPPTQKSQRNRFVFKTMFLYQTLVVKTIPTDAILLNVEAAVCEW